jgi:alginate O-acetyltransferase complex protein AlgI
MVFSSLTFLFYFLPAFLLLYYALPWPNLVLLLGSLVFYAWGEPRFVPLLLASALLNYGAGRLLRRWRKRGVLALGIGANLAMLCWFKYAGFLAQAANSAGTQLTVPDIVLPLGISFFTFQGISYLVDVYRGEVDAQQSFLRFATYKAMFPQLIAGPIVRYRDVARDIDARQVDHQRILQGVQLFAAGLAMKVLLANTLAVPADAFFNADPGSLGAAAAWLGLACYSLQILFDFAGYSAMAIGLGHLLGFTYPPNFNRPYSARSVTEFWQRWHISLSTWFRDYLYIPLGGNRRGPWRTYFNLALVFLLCGLWHGAAWTFVAWGAWHGSLLVAERMAGKRLLDRLPGPLAQAVTLLLVMLGWVLFRAADLAHAAAYYQALLGMSQPGAGALPWPKHVGPLEWTALAAGLGLALPRALPSLRANAFLVRLGAAAAGLGLSAASLAGGTYNPFIYYRF